MVVYNFFSISDKAILTELQASAGLFSPVSFDSSKLAINFLPGAQPVRVLPQLSRRYTLTHSDLTGKLLLSIGPDYNWKQISGWYTGLIRSGAWLAAHTYE